MLGLRLAIPMALLLATAGGASASLLATTTSLITLDDDDPILGIEVDVGPVWAEGTVDSDLEDPILAVEGEALGTTAGAIVGGDFLVGYKPGQEDAALLAIQLAGGTVRRVQPDLRVADVEAADGASFQTTVILSPGVEYVEQDGPTGMDGTQWNGAQWNGAQWNGAEWNGAQWNGAQWNGAQWNGAQWNGAQWNGAQWNGAQWNAYWHAPDSANDPGRVAQWGIPATDTPQAWQTTTGTRAASLCVLDSGVAGDHRDLAANMGSRSHNAIDPDASAYDDAGHGTHVAGIAAATVGNGWGVAGVGNVKILPVKVLDATGSGTEADLAFGIAWCANAGADVAVMALSVTDPGPALDAALAYAASRDVLLVASSGNDAAGAVNYPASHPDVLAVGSVSPRLQRSAFGNVGAQLDVVAPGEYILSTFLDGRFAYGSGTSQAVAFVAGAAALARDANPGASAAETRAALLAGARDLGAAGKDTTYGHGLLDTEAAVRIL